jgi:hypothetical protein
MRFTAFCCDAAPRRAGFPTLLIHPRYQGDVPAWIRTTPRVYRCAPADAEAWLYLRAIPSGNRTTLSLLPDVYCISLQHTGRRGYASQKGLAQPRRLISLRKSSMAV